MFANHLPGQHSPTKIKSEKNSGKLIFLFFKAPSIPGEGSSV